MIYYDVIDRGEIYYNVIDKGGIVMDARGKEVMEYMRGVVFNLYRDYFIKFRESCLVRVVIDVVCSQSLIPTCNILKYMEKDKNKGDLK